MIGATRTNPYQAHDELIDRCRTIGLPVWQFDTSGRVRARPSGFGPADPWLQSPALDAMIGRAIGKVEDRLAAVPVIPFDGCCVHVLNGALAKASDDVAAVVVFEPAVLDSEQFLAICSAAALDARATRERIEAFVTEGSSATDRIGRLLRWIQGDLLRTCEQSGVTSHFSDQLVDAYEQISLLYRLGRTMSRLSEPEQFLETATSLLVNQLEFDWIAVRLRSGGTLPQVVPHCVVSGTIPCSRSRFDFLTGAVVDRLPGDNWTVLLEVGENDLATETGAQVVIEPIVAADRVIGALVAGNKQAIDPEVTSVETQLLDATADFLGAFLNNVEVYQEQRSLFLGSVQALTAAIDAKDRYTRGHSERVALLGAMLAGAIGLDDQQIEQVRVAGLVHDVGKIGVPEAVLRKTGKLTDEEFEQIKRHPVIGYEIIKGIAAMSHALDGVLYHHERWDGRGYPEGLAGEDIPQVARILAVADAFDAMSSTRSYRPAMPREKVLVEMRRCAGSQFDATLATAFLELSLTAYDDMVERHRVREIADAA